MRKLLSAVLLLFASLAAHAQGSALLFPPLQGPNGGSIPFAHLTFCTFPATFDSLGNCTNTITVFQDIGLTIPYGSAIITDGLGNFPPNGNTTTALWFTPANNLCYTATGANILHTVNVCTPFSVSIVPGSSPTYATVTITASGNFAETTAPSGLAGFDILYGDSSLHRPRFINNNGAAVSIALLTDSLASFTGTFTSAQLAALVTDETGSGALVFANGGTIAPTSVTTGQIIQPAATVATWKDNTGGIRASIPSNGTSQGTLNNWNLTGGSSISGTAVGGTSGTGNVIFDTSPAITTPTIARETVNTGISQGSGFKHQRFGATNATAAAAGSTATTAYTWTSAFADANYTIVCQGITQANIPILAVEGVIAAGFTVRVSAATAAAASYAGVDCFAVHD